MFQAYYVEDSSVKLTSRTAFFAYLNHYLVRTFWISKPFIKEVGIHAFNVGFRRTSL